MLPTVIPCIITHITNACITQYPPLNIGKTKAVPKAYLMGIHTEENFLPSISPSCAVPKVPANIVYAANIPPTAKIAPLKTPTEPPKAFIPPPPVRPVNI